MGRRLIEVMQVLVDQIHKGGYQHRVLEDSIYEESQRRIAVEKERDAARSEIDTLRKKLADAKHEDYENEIRAAAALICPEASGETTIPGMAGEILRLRKQLDEARAEIERLQGFVNLSRRFLGDTVRYANVDRLRAGLAELDAGTEPTPVAEPLDAEGGA